MIQLTHQRSPSIRDRIRLLLLCWAGIFVVTMAVDLTMPYTFSGALVRLPVNIVTAPLILWTGCYCIGGRRARRLWLIYRFVLANCLDVDAIVEHERRPRPIRRRTIYPFWWAEKRRSR